MKPKKSIGVLALALVLLLMLSACSSSVHNRQHNYVYESIEAALRFEDHKEYKICSSAEELNSFLCNAGEPSELEKNILSKFQQEYFEEYALLFVSFRFSSSDRNIEFCKLDFDNDASVVTAIFDVHTPEMVCEDLRYMRFVISNIPREQLQDVNDLQIKVHNTMRPNHPSAYYDAA